MVFARVRSDGIRDLYQKDARGLGPEELLALPPSTSRARSDWSPDGRYLLYRNQDPVTQHDIWALPIDGDRKPFPVVHTAFSERDAQFSPDGKWIAYQSDESGHFEIYLQPFPGPGPKVQVSTDGGAQARWRRDGSELFYVTLAGELTAVPIQLASNREPVVGDPAVLFPVRFRQTVDNLDGAQYVVSSDGQRFLMYTVLDEAASPITVILNWRAKL